MTSSRAYVASTPRGRLNEQARSPPVARQRDVIALPKTGLHAHGSIEAAVHGEHAVQLNAPALEVEVQISEEEAQKEEVDYIIEHKFQEEEEGEEKTS